MKEKEIIKEYLESINFSTYEGYIHLIENYVKFKELKNKSKVPQETKGCKK